MFSSVCLSDVEIRAPGAPKLLRWLVMVCRLLLMMLALAKSMRRLVAQAQECV
jgi:hypothetical protein